MTLNLEGLEYLVRDNDFELRTTEPEEVLNYTCAWLMKRGGGHIDMENGVIHIGKKVVSL